MNKIYLSILTVLFTLVSFAQSSLYVRGTSYNYPQPKLVKLDNQVIMNSTSRGLSLTIIDAFTHQHLSSTNYDTYGNASASDNLAIALNNLKRGQIGILTSYDAWENAITNNLKIAARRLGLFKLGGGLASGSRRSYAAIFRGSGTNTNNSTPNHIAYEIMQSNNSESEYAVIATWLIDDAFIGNNLSNALVYGDGNYSGAALLVDHLGNIGIGTNSPDAKLTVNGNIHTTEVKVDLSVPGPDYVFKDDYKLMSLEQTQKYIKENGHLPNIPSAKEMEENGVELGVMNMKLLEKIEELTLYTLEQEKSLKEYKKNNDQLLVVINEMKNRLLNLEMEQTKKK